MKIQCFQALVSNVNLVHPYDEAAGFEGATTIEEKFAALRSRSFKREDSRLNWILSKMATELKVDWVV